MHKKRVLSGIRATGRLHLGNYLGAVKGMLELQDSSEYETLYMVADGHTITTPYSVDELKKNRREIVIDYLAAGLNPEKSTIFIQSDIAEHFELAFLLSSVVSIARMNHLPTYKDKVKQHPKANTMALLNYPVLMSADILIYKAEAVPVGVDQEPHLEVAREIARKMNNQYFMDFPEPKRFETKGGYVPSLLGEGKMSKSVEGSYVNMMDDLEMIKKKVAKMPTDEGRGTEVPAEGAVASFFKYIELFMEGQRRKEVESGYTSNGIRYGDLKKELSEAIYEELKPYQERRRKLEKDVEYVDRVIAEGTEKARKLAKRTLDEVKSKMGLA